MSLIFDYRNKVPAFFALICILIKPKYTIWSKLLIRDTKPMKLHGRRSAIEYALDFVKDNLDKGVWKEGEFLPSVRRLSLMASVSKSTMLIAIAHLSAQGLVTVAPRHRIRAGNGELPLPMAQDIHLPSQKVRAIFERDLLSGLYGFRDTLPPAKELLARYGVSYVTMRKIMRSLMVDGIVKPYGRGYRIPKLAIRSSHQRIIFITIQGHVAQSSALNIEHNRIANLFENECRRLGMVLEIIEMDFFDAARTRQAASGLLNNDTIIGFILDVWNYGIEHYANSYHDVLNRLCTFRKPVALLDELGNYLLSIHHSANPLLQVFRIESEKAGIRVARFLIEQGHRACAYITCFHETGWSRERFSGIVKQFSRVGYSKNVHLCSIQAKDSLMYMLAMSGLEDAELQRLNKVGRTPGQYKDFEAQWNAYKERNQPQLLIHPADQSELKRSLAPLCILARSGIADDLLKRLGPVATELPAEHLTRLLFKPGFQKALNHRDATAWICANDFVAFEALSFLQAHKIRPGKEISVVSFDNTPSRALERQLTTFDFNAMGFVNQMLGFILRPPKPRGPYRHSPIEVEGMIIERGSTGKARKGQMAFEAK
jgi:DNA-binding FadR family transcriptional regulator